MFSRYIGGVSPPFCACCLTCKYSVFFWIGEKKYQIASFFRREISWSTHKMPSRDNSGMSCPRVWQRRECLDSSTRLFSRGAVPRTYSVSPARPPPGRSRHRCSMWPFVRPSGSYAVDRCPILPFWRDVSFDSRAAHTTSVATTCQAWRYRFRCR